MMVIDVIAPAAPVIDVSAPAAPIIDIVMPPVVISGGVSARSARVGNFLYIGKAAIGADEDVAVWVITRIELDEPCVIVEILHATNVKWSEHETVIYS